MKRRTLCGLLLLAATTICFVGIVVARQGPAPGGDTTPLTTVTSALATGHLRAAAANEQLPNPPGYALLTSPFVAALPSLLGSPTWCVTPTRAQGLRGEPAFRHDPTFANDVGECGHPRRLPDGALGPALPPWYRAQGVLGVTAWLVLATGSLALLRAGATADLGRVAGLLVFLAFLPAASSAIVQLYHPQDMVSLGLSLAGMAQTLRRRWILAGALFGLAALTKQYAFLLLLPAVAVAPSTPARIRTIGAAATVLGVGISVFLVAAPGPTIDNFSGFAAGGALSGQTVLTVAGVTGKLASAIARDAPIVFALGTCIWASRRHRAALARPEVFVALGLACVGSRLVFESVVYPYYLLATSVLFFMTDLVARRTPQRSLAWCAGAAFFVAVRPGNRMVDALGTLFFAVLAVAAGLRDTVRASDTTPGRGAQLSARPAA